MRAYEFIMEEAIKLGEPIPLSWLRSQKINQIRITGTVHFIGSQ